MLTPDVKQNLVAGLLNVWNFCGSDRAFWKEQNAKHPELTEADRLNIIETADRRWKSGK